MTKFRNFSIRFLIYLWPPSTWRGPPPYMNSSYVPVNQYIKIYFFPYNHGVRSRKKFVSAQLDSIYNYNKCKGKVYTCTCWCWHVFLHVRHSVIACVLTFYMDISVNHLKFPFPLTFPAKTFWVPAHCKISSEIFVGARAPRTRPSAPHDCICMIRVFKKSPIIQAYIENRLIFGKYKQENRKNTRFN